MNFGTKETEDACTAIQVAPNSRSSGAPPAQIRGFAAEIAGLVIGSGDDDAIDILEIEQGAVVVMDAPVGLAA